MLKNHDVWKSGFCFNIKTAFPGNSFYKGNTAVRLGYLYSGKLSASKTIILYWRSPHGLSDMLRVRIIVRSFDLESDNVTKQR